jgi:hypothetical protein
MTTPEPKVQQTPEENTTYIPGEMQHDPAFIRLREKLRQDREAAAGNAHDQEQAIPGD